MVRKTFTLEISVPANTPANYRSAVNIIDHPRPAVPIYNIPKGYKLTVTDIYIKDTADVGVESVGVVVKDLIQDKLKTAPLTTLLVSNPARPMITPIEFDEYQKLSVDLITLEAVGATAVTVKFYMDVEEVKKGAGAKGFLEPLQKLF